MVQCLTCVQVNYVIYLVVTARRKVSQSSDSVKKVFKRLFLCDLIQLIEAGSRWQCLFSQRYSIVEKCYSV